MPVEVLLLGRERIVSLGMLVIQRVLRDSPLSFGKPPFFLTIINFVFGKEELSSSFPFALLWKISFLVFLVGHALDVLEIERRDVRLENNLCMRANLQDWCKALL